MSGVPTTVTPPTVRNTTGEWGEERERRESACTDCHYLWLNVFIGLLETHTPLPRPLETRPQTIFIFIFMI